MIQKQVYDLTKEDLERFPVWYFPMDATVDDEMTVRPYPTDTSLGSDFQVIVRTHFATKDGRRFLGYIYWGYPHDVKYLQPVMYAPGCCVTFWNGLVKPSDEYLIRLDKLMPEFFPISFKSEEIHGLPSIYGVLEGRLFQSR